MRNMTFILILMAVGLAFIAGPVNAQQQSDSWAFRLTPYLVGAAIGGDVTIHGHTAEVDAGFDKILANLDFAVMLHFLAAKGPWSIGLDGFFVGLGQEADRPPAELYIDQWFLELAGGYQLKPWLHAFAGARYNFLSSEIEIHGSGEREKSGDVNWIDPIIGTRLSGRLGEKWSIYGRADIGGFGIGSNLTWQLAAYVDFRASDLIAIIGGYRFLSNDYETGSGNELFHYDMNIFGPALGLSFIF